MISTSTKSDTAMETANLCHLNGPQLVTAQDLPAAITEMIQQQITKLKQEYGYIRHCKVNVAVPMFCQTGIYQVRIVLSLPTLDLKVDRDPTPDYYQEDIYVAIWSAFDLARKKLKEYTVPINTNEAKSLETVLPRPIQGIRRSRGYTQG